MKWRKWSGRPIAPTGSMTVSRPVSGALSHGGGRWTICEDSHPGGAQKRLEFGEAAGVRHTRRDAVPALHSSLRRGRLYSWDTDLVRGDLRVYAVRHLSDANGVLAMDETSFLKKSNKSVGVQRHGGQD